MSEEVAKKLKQKAEDFYKLLLQYSKEHPQSDVAFYMARRRLSAGDEMKEAYWLERALKALLKKNKRPKPDPRLRPVILKKSEMRKIKRANKVNKEKNDG